MYSQFILLKLGIEHQIVQEDVNDSNSKVSWSLRCQNDFPNSHIDFVVPD